MGKRASEAVELPDHEDFAAAAFRTQSNDIQRYITLLKDAARKISAGLGW